MKNLQRGFTLIELSLVAMIVAIATATVVLPWRERTDDAKLHATIAQARTLAAIAEQVRRTALDTTVDGKGIYRHRYPLLPADSTVADLLALAASNLRLPNDSPFGTPYRVEVTASAAAVTVRVPTKVTPIGVQTVDVPDGTDLIVAARSPVNRALLTRQAVADKVQWYLEEVR